MDLFVLFFICPQTTTRPTPDNHFSKHHHRVAGVVWLGKHSAARQKMDGLGCCNKQHIQECVNEHVHDDCSVNVTVAAASNNTRIRVVNTNVTAVIDVCCLGRCVIAADAAALVQSMT